MTPNAIKALSHADALHYLAELHGHLADPQPGSMHITLDLDGASVLVEYEFGDDNETHLLAAFVNGNWVDADKFDAAQRDEWIEAIDADVTQSNTRHREDAQADAWRDAA